MAAPALTPDVTVEDRVTVLTLGPGYETLDEHVLDSGLRDALLDLTENANPPLVVLDLSNTRFFGSSFIEILFRIWNRLQGKPEGTFVLCGLTPYCLEVLKITHLDSLWQLFTDRSAAVKALSRRAG